MNDKYHSIMDKLIPYLKSFGVYQDTCDIGGFDSAAEYIEHCIKYKVKSGDKSRFLAKSQLIFDYFNYFDNCETDESTVEVNEIKMNGCYSDRLAIKQIEECETSDKHCSQMYLTFHNTQSICDVMLDVDNSIVIYNNSENRVICKTNKTSFLKRFKSNL